MCLPDTKFYELRRTNNNDCNSHYDNPLAVPLGHIVDQNRSLSYLKFDIPMAVCVSVLKTLELALSDHKQLKGEF